MLETKKISCDLCVVGGGLSGMAAAISAAREGLQVVLMHERAVLGGNASSEIRMWISGARGESNRETGIIEEIILENHYRNPTKSYAVWDTVLYDFIRREKNIRLLLNCTCMDCKTETGDFSHGRSIRINSVTGYQMTTQRFFCVEAKFFADCSGDSILAPLSGAQYRIGREAGIENKEDTGLAQADKMTMGMSCLIQGRETANPIPYIPHTWSSKLQDADFEDRMPNLYDDAENFWYLELGGNRDSIGDTEEIRDELLELATGTWDYIKRNPKFGAQNWDLDFLGFLPGKRESRRMVGEYTLTQRDISDGTVFRDEIAFGGWPLDDHFPGGFYHKGTPNTDIATPAPYSIPYRTLYSANVDNLFFAGRNISVTHFALSSVRVMATCALLGEAVGKAAFLAANKDCTPHDVYLTHLETLQQLLLNADCFLPSKRRYVSQVCAAASLQGADDSIRNGIDRAHPIYPKTPVLLCEPGDEIRYTFPAAAVESIHIVFDSDLNRKTLPGSWVEQGRCMRSNQRLDQPQTALPLTLCKEFELSGYLQGEKQFCIHVEENRKRAYHIAADQRFDSLVLKPLQSWGSGPIPIISFDFQ